MYYDKSSSNISYNLKKVIIVDLRSDTLTKPTQKMKEALSSAEVGDDVFCEDPTVKVLQETAAKMVEMEDALFVCSGTMGNLIAIMNHCNVRGSEAYCGESAHTLLHEQTGAAQIAGVNLRSLRNNIDGTFDLCELQSKLRHDRDHEPISKLVLVENTINGKIVPQSWLKELVSFCKKYNLKLHMDGARLWNASVGSGIPAKEIVSGFDSVTFCLSKGLEYERSRGRRGTNKQSKHDGQLEDTGDVGDPRLGTTGTIEQVPAASLSDICKETVYGVDPRHSASYDWEDTKNKKYGRINEEV